MSEISINTVENIDEIVQIILLTTYTTKLQRYYRVTLHILDFHRKFFPEIPPPFITFARALLNCTDKCYLILHQECKAEEDSNPRLNGNPFQDNQLHADHCTINLMMKLHTLFDIA